VSAVDVNKTLTIETRGQTEAFSIQHSDETEIFHFQKNLNAESRCMCGLPGQARAPCGLPG